MVEESLGKSHPHIERIREPYCGSFKLLYAKMWSFAFLPEERSRICVFFCFRLFFSVRDCVDRIILECSERAHFNGN